MSFAVNYWFNDRGPAAAYRSFLRTLRRLPRPIVLCVAGREIQPTDPVQCLCGWALAAGLAQAAKKDAADDDIQNEVRECHPPLALAQRYGGTVGSWRYIYQGVMHPDILPVIEAALITRLFEVTP